MCEFIVYIDLRVVASAALLLMLRRRFPGATVVFDHGDHQVPKEINHLHSIFTNGVNSLYKCLVAR